MQKQKSLIDYGLIEELECELLEYYQKHEPAT